MWKSKVFIKIQFPVRHPERSCIRLTLKKKSPSLVADWRNFENIFFVFCKNYM